MHTQVEMQASMVDQIVTETTLYATAGHAFGVGVKVHKMLKISAVATGDAAFSKPTPEDVPDCDAWSMA